MFRRTFFILAALVAGGAGKAIAQTNLALNPSFETVSPQIVNGQGVTEVPGSWSQSGSNGCGFQALQTGESTQLGSDFTIGDNASGPTAGARVLISDQGPPSTSCQIFQDVALPANSTIILTLDAGFTFSDDDSPGSNVLVQVTRTNGTVLATLYSRTDTQGADALATRPGVDLSAYAGQTVRIIGSVNNPGDNYAGLQMDNVRLIATLNSVSQTISFGTLGNKNYGDAAFGVSATATSGLAVTFSSTTSGVCTVSGATVTIVATGTCTVAADQAGNSTYSAAPEVTQSFTVNKALLLVTADAKTITYPATLPTLTVTITGFVYGQNSLVLSGAPSLSSNATLTNGKPNAGSWTLTAAIGTLAAANYNFSFATGTLTVNKATLTVSADPQTINYGASPVFTATISGLTNGDTILAISGAPSFGSNATLTRGNPNAGSWTITPALGSLSAANYSFSFSAGTLTVNKAPLTAIADPQTMNYGGIAPSFTVSFSGLVNGDVSAGASGTAGFSTNATLTNGNPNAGVWTITPALGTLTAVNYSFAVFNSGTLTVNKASLTESADAKTITYGASAPAFTATLTGFVNGDTSSVVSGSPSFTTNTTLTNGNPNAGSWTITPTAGSLSAANYTFGFASRALTVNRATLTVSSDAKTIAYGASPAYSATLTGFVNSDTSAVVSGSPGFTTNAAMTNGNPNAGSWTITPTAGTLAAANYTFGFAPAALTVSKAALLVTADSKTVGYGANAAYTATFTGFVNGDTSAAVSGSPSLTTNASLTNGNPNAGSWTITPTAGTLAAANYTFSFAPGTLTVSKAVLTVTADAKTVTYGASPVYTATITGYVNGDTSAVVGGSPSFSTNATLTNGNPNAGSWTITPTAGTLSASNYTFGFAPGSLTVSKISLTVTADSKAVTYGASAAYTATITGFVNGETSATVSGSPGFTANATLTNGNPNAGSWTITPTAGTLTASNYTFGFTSGSLTVSKAALTVTADAKVVTYGASAAYTATFTGFVNSDTSAVVSGAPNFATNATLTNGNPNAGSWTITPAAGTLAAVNYTFGFAPGTLTVNKKALTVAADSKSITYGASPVYTATIAGFVNGDTSAVVSGAPSFATNAALTNGNPNAGTWTITPAAGTLAASNYSFSFAPGTLTVSKTALTVTADAKVVTYGTSAGYTATITGFVNGDTSAMVSGAPSFTTNATLTNGNPNAGSWTITPAAGTLSAANYTLGFAPGTLTVSKAALTVTADAKTITYGTSPAYTATSSGFVNSDTPAVVSGSANFTTNATLTNGNPNAGSWTITPAAGTLSAANYTLGFAPGALTVSKKALTVTADAKNVTYGAGPVYTATIAGFVNGDTSAAVSGSAKFTTNATLTNGNPNAGSWTITPAAGTLAASNYSFSFAPGTLTVSKTALTVTADAKAVTYGTSPAYTATLTGFVNSDTAAVVIGTASFTTNATLTNGNPNAGSWTITPAVGTMSAANYTLGFAPGTLTVTKAALTVTADAKTVTYGTSPAYTATLTGFVNSDTAAVVTGAASFTTNATLTNGNLNAGSWTITPAAGTLSAPNYTFGFATGTLTIGKKALTVTAEAKAVTFGASPVYTATFTGFVSGDTPSVVTGSAKFTTNATLTNGNPNAGSWTITPSAGTLSSANYSFTFATGALTVVKAGSTVTLTNSGTTLTATVAPLPAGAGLPTGTVQFMSGSTILGTVPLVGPTATFNGSPGIITAVYSGDSNFGGSTSNAVTVYQPATSSMTLISSQNPAPLGQSVTLTATLYTNGGPPTAGAPTGAVQFLDGAKLLGSTNLSSSQATFTTSSLTGGPHTIIAQFAGDSNWPAAQATLTQTVNAAVTISLTATPAPVYGQAVTLTANVSAPSASGLAAPTGQVTFSLAAGNSSSQPLGSSPLTSGTATFDTSTLPVGTQTITALYSGDNAWSSSSRSIPVTISPASTQPSISLTLVSGQLVLGTTVSVIAPGAGSPTGSVQFIDSITNTPVGSANLSSGKASLTVGAGAASAVLARPISAVYSGDAAFKGGTATLPAVQNSAASISAAFAVDEVVSLFGIVGLVGDIPATVPLTTSLGGVTVTLVDSGGTSRPAPLYGVFASAGQINALIPADTAPGVAAVTITLPDKSTVMTAIRIADSEPGVFTANMTGQDTFAGQVLYVHADGTQTVAGSTTFDTSTNTNVPVPINLGTPGDQVFLVLYATGVRHASTVTATLNNISIPVVYFGAQGTFQGLDQINLGPLPATLAGAGSVNLVISTDGQAANSVLAVIK